MVICFISCTISMCSFHGQVAPARDLSLTTFFGLHKEQSLWCDALMLIDFCDILKIYHMSRETLFALYLIGAKQ